jgi:tetratricopeptide (TPR) repeat protein
LQRRTPIDFVGGVRDPLQAAIGYLQLGMWQDAANEIERLPPERKVGLDVLEVRIEIYREAKAWRLMEVVARELLRQMPEHPAPWLHLAYAVRRSESLSEAKEVLEAAIDNFPDNATIHFNLGCYLCQLGDNERAKAHVARAVELDFDFRSKALDDPDLEPLWAEWNGEWGGKK